LPAERYDLRDATGRRVRSISRDRAAVLLATGKAEAIGRGTVKYLKLDAEIGGSLSKRPPRSLQPWTGAKTAPGSDIATYAHDDEACATWRRVRCER
jgi:hypothetical protein